MTERLELYKCETCGNLVQVVLPGVGELVCCGKPMTLLKPHQIGEEFSEKHVPIFTATDKKGEEVRVGTTLHPMTEDHYIQFIEVISEGKNHLDLQYYAPFDMPIMILKDKLGDEKAQAFCNLHGLWEGDND